MIMHPSLSAPLAKGGFILGQDDIYSAPIHLFTSEQNAERELRERVAAQQYDDYLLTLSKHHSIPVMDHEVDRFLKFIPERGVILDIGGCWGWHWRRLATTRPDVGVLIIDFVRANLLHAKKMLGSLVGEQIALMHADATALPFPTANAPHSGFDGIWTVQVFQHIPDFARACSEADRVLKTGGHFFNYSLSCTPLNKMIYRLLSKTFHVEGNYKNQFILNRANDRQRDIVSNIFFWGGDGERAVYRVFVSSCSSLTFSGRQRSYIGRIDALCGDAPWLGVWNARQRSFYAQKLPVPHIR